ncbi:MAG: DUF1822 family protein [Leptolyngbya sp. DLM2.Bin15]|nr:MAG: DUF1822 family protein [Leptolyngbya sp. DLM2.Bin15]
MIRNSHRLELDTNAHELARVAAQVHGDRPLIAQQVYINTLCVCAVYDYLSQQGYTIDLLNRDSADPVLQAMMNVADLRIPQVGSVECRPVWSGDTILSIPEEVWSDRSGYLAVQLSPKPDENLAEPLPLASLRSIRTAVMLGFTPVPATAIALTDLDPLDLLLGHIETAQTPVRLPSPVRDGVVSLMSWFQDIYDDTWQSVAQLLDRSDSSLALNFRSRVMAPPSTLMAPPQRVERGKYITLTPPIHPPTQVIVVIGIITDTLSELDICIEIHPGMHQMYLPPDLALSVLNASQDPVMHVKASDDNDLMALTFSAERGECFSIQIHLGSECYEEQFQL